MIFLTAMALGTTAVMLRSAFCVIMVCLLLVGAFGAAVLVSSGPVSFLPLLAALAGYNAGLIGVVGGLLVLNRFGLARA
jgi:hypothetical protein